MFENCSQVILKVTKDCNLRCTYCYIKDKDLYKGKNMSFALFKRLIQRIIIDRAHSLHPPKNMLIVFHGGEPTLLGKSKLQKFIDYAKAHIHSVDFNIVTNASTIDKEWIALFLKNNISPCISIDGITSSENIFRKQGFSLHKKLDLLRKNKLNTGILSIVSAQNYKHFPKTVQRFMRYTTKNTPGSIRANYIEDLNTPALSDYEVTGNDIYASIYKPLLEEALRKEAPPNEVNLKIIINKYAESLLTDQSPAQNDLNCYTKFCRGGNSIVEVEPTGEVNFCGRWDTLRSISTVGHIEKPDPWGILSLQTALNLQILKINDMQIKQCDSCPAAVICDYGCIAFSYIKYNGNVKIRKEISCDLFMKLQKMLYLHRYKILILFAKQRGFTIEETKTVYVITLPKDLHLKKTVTDKTIHMVNKKLYISKKTITGSKHSR